MADYRIGLTGGIASGKSALSYAFEALGVVVADADVAAREALAVGSAGLAEVIAMFGREVLAADGSLDRGAMRRRVFDDPDARRRLEAIVHPRVRKAMESQCAQAPGPYAIAAIPLLTEVGAREAYPWLQRILLIDVSVQTQRARLLARDGIDIALAERMISSQATREQRLAIADDIMRNEGSLDDLRTHARALDAQYRVLAAASRD